MELLVVGILIIAFLLILGVPVYNILIGILWTLDGIAWFFTLFFVIALLMLMFTRRKEVEFVGFDKKNIGKYNVSYAIYKLDGQEYKNTFPTDSFAISIGYKRKNPKIRVGKLGKKNFVFDGISQFIIAFGLIIFAMLALTIVEILKQGMLVL